MLLQRARRSTPHLRSCRGPEDAVPVRLPPQRATVTHRHRWLLGRVGRSSARPGPGSAVSVVHQRCALCGQRRAVRRVSVLLRQAVEFREARR